MKKKVLATVLSASLLVPTFFVADQGNVQKVEAATQFQFKDIPTNHIYYDVIHKMKEKGIVNGYDDGTFKPSEKVSRVHAALIISRVLDLDTDNVVNPNFKDVPTTHIYYKQIAAVQNAGVMSGKEGNLFDPNGKLTRAQMAVILANALELEGVSTKQFTDVQKGHWAYSYVQALAKNKITNGYGDGTFKPNEKLSRQHYALFLNAALEYKENGGVVNPTPEPEVPTTPEVPNIPSTDVSSYPNNVLTMKDARSTSDLKIPGGKTLKQIQDEQAAKNTVLYEKNNITTFLFTTTVEPTNPLFESVDESLTRIAKTIGKSKAETIQIINYAYATGDVYDGGSFVLSYDYQQIGVNYAFDSQYLWD